MIILRKAFTVLGLIIRLRFLYLSGPDRYSRLLFPGVKLNRSASWEPFRVTRLPRFELEGHAFLAARILRVGLRENVDKGSASSPT
jgi:hypothetical protein